MARSNLSVIVSVLSLFVAAGSVVTLFSVRRVASTGNSQLSATSYQIDDPAVAQAPLSIDPAIVRYSQTAEIALDFKKVSALAVDAEDRIYVAGDKSLCCYSPQGRLEMRIPLSNEPTCVTVASQQHFAPGRIYVGFMDHVEVYEAKGTQAGIWQGLGDKARFTSISSSDNYIFIADAGQSVVQRFDWTGKLLESFGDANPSHFASVVKGALAPFAVVVGLDDLVYIVNRREHRVEGYNFQGQMERHWGQGSPVVEDFAGLSNPSHLAYMPNGNFVTAEEDPLRVKVYMRSGQFGGVVCGPEGTGSVVDLAADHHQRILVLDGQARCVRVFIAKKPAEPK